MSNIEAIFEEIDRVKRELGESMSDQRRELLEAKLERLYKRAGF